MEGKGGSICCFNNISNHINCFEQNKGKKKNKKDNNYLAINVISHPNIANNIFFRITTYELYRVEGLQYVSVRNG